MAHLVVVRHAAPLRSGACYGRTEEPTNFSARLAAVLLGHVRSYVGRGSCHIVSSPAERCRVVAEFLAAELFLPQHTDPRLSELNFGDFEGRKWESLAAEPEFRRWTENWKTQAPPDGESLPEFCERVRGWLTEPVKESRIVITHAGVIRALWVSLDGLSWDQAMQRRVPYLRPLVWDRSPIESVLGARMAGSER